MVDMIVGVYSRLHTDGNSYWWVPPTEVFVQSGSSTVTVNVTDSP